MKFKVLLLSLWFIISIGSVILPSSSDELMQAMAGYVEAEEAEAQLFKAIVRGDVDGIRRLLVQGVDVNARDKEGNTPFSLAVLYNNPSIARLLLQAGARGDVVVTNEDDWARAAGFDVDDPGYEFDFGSVWNKVWDDRKEIRHMIDNFLIFKLLNSKKIDRQFDKEPEPMNYISEYKQKSLEEALDRYVQAVQDNSGNELNLSKEIESVLDNEHENVNRFQHDLEDYWRDRLQKAYHAYLWDENPRPLIDILTKEIYERSGLMLMIRALIDDEDFCLHCVLNKFVHENRKILSRDEAAKINELAKTENDIDRNIAAEKIQKAWKKYKQSDAYVRHLRDSIEEERREKGNLERMEQEIRERNDQMNERWGQMWEEELREINRFERIKKLRKFIGYAILTGIMKAALVGKPVKA